MILGYAGLEIAMGSPTHARSWAYVADNYAKVSSRFLRELRAVRLGDWKLIEERYRDRTVYQLFNLGVDPLEAHPLNGSEYDLIEQQLLDLLGPRSAGRAGMVGFEALDAEVLQSLRALGYVQ
jgi:hypothetical protein